MSINKIKTILSIVIVSCVLFLGVGYAVVSQDLIFGSEITGTTQEKVFITDFSGTSTGGTVNSNSFIKDILTSDISLNDASSSLTYTVQVYNNADKPYCYIGTNYNSTLGYSNFGIDFKLSMIEGEWDTSKENTSVVESKKYLSFDITFFNEGDGSNLSLASVLQFLFIPLEEAQKVTLTYAGETYVDAFRKTETVATFPDLHFDVEPLYNRNNVARCNLDATPVYDATLKQIHVTGVNSAGNNVNNEVKCEVYNSLNEAISDAEFEPSNYTINNFLVLIDNKYGGVGAVVPENLEFNVDLNHKKVDYIGGNTMLTMEQASVLNLFNGSEIECTNKSPSIFLVNHEKAVLNINGGTYLHANSGNLFVPKKGTILSRNATYYSTKGNIFMIGTHSAAEAAATPYSVHIEIIGGKVQTDGANIVHSTSRHQVLFSFVNVEAIAAVNFIVCNNNAGDDSLVVDNPAPSTYDNVRFYVTGGSITAGKSDFSTRGSYLFYTENITYKGSNSTNDMRGVKVSDYVPNSDYFKYAVKNYTTSTEEDWYYVKNTNGGKLYASNGEAIKVGDRISINSYKSTTYNIGMTKSPSESGVELKTATRNDNSDLQKWMFLLSYDEGYYNLAPYYYPSKMVWIHVASVNILPTGGNYIDLQNIAGLKDQPGGRFRFKPAVDTSGKPLNGKFSILNKVDAGWPHGEQTWGLSFALDITTSDPMQAGLLIQGYKDNNTLAQQWILIKHNK